MSGALSSENLVTAVAFVGVVAAGLGWFVLRGAMADSPQARIRQRLIDSVAELSPVAEAEAETAVHRRQSGDDALTRLVLKIKGQAEHMGGTAAVRGLVLAMVVAMVAAGVLVALSGLSLWWAAAATLPGGVLGGFLAFRFMQARYRRRFTDGFPDALDLMIRAVRAGVPVVQAIISAGRELPDPVGREFRMMGDALRLGMDAQDVMDQASQRIGVADFRFYVVCLQLQRETGGPLAETLENLSSIIRARREVRMKTNALTAQGRASSKIIAAVPFVLMGALHFMGGGYLDVLFHTESGQHVLWLAGGLVFTGLFVISRMARLED